MFRHIKLQLEIKKWFVLNSLNYIDIYYEFETDQKHFMVFNQKCFQHFRLNRLFYFFEKINKRLTNPRKLISCINLIMKKQKPLQKPKPNPTQPKPIYIFR